MEELTSHEPQMAQLGNSLAATFRLSLSISSDSDPYPPHVGVGDALEGGHVLGDAVDGDSVDQRRSADPGRRRHGAGQQYAGDDGDKRPC